jgi:molybdenum cofactor biosynthesis protein B
MTVEEHERQSQQQLGQHPAPCAVITVSDSRTLENDASGTLLVNRLEDAGHALVVRELVPDEEAAIEVAFTRASNAGVELLLTTGGTGIAPRDRTIEVLQPRCSRMIPGFGELFRTLSHEEIGAAAMLSRASGGIVQRDDGSSFLLFMLPGSPKAIDLALDRLILPQLAHMRMLLQSDA